MTQTEMTAVDDRSLRQRWSESIFKVGFLLVIAVAMIGWLAFLGWLAWSALGL